MRSTELTILVFTILYLAVAAPFAAASANHEFVFYIGVMVFLIAAVVAVHRRVGLHPASLWCMSAWGLLHMAGGLVTVSEEVGVLYSYWLVPGRLKYDQVVHAFGFGVTTWLVWQGLRAATGQTRPTLGLLFIAASAGMGLGALNEVIEFVAVLTMPDTNVGDYANTSWDLVANAVGAVVASLWIRLAHRESGSGGSSRAVKDPGVGGGLGPWHP